MTLPNNIFFTGVPGSRWSGIAQLLEELPNFNSTDRTIERSYTHREYSGHKGAYFGREMEFSADHNNTSQAYTIQDGCKVLKSHDWAYKLDEIYNERVKQHGDWIMLVYRPDLASYTWWHEAGGFNIKYPNYSAYKDGTTMLYEIQKQNEAMLEFAYDMDLEWSHINNKWFERTFNTMPATEFNKWKDILVTVIKR